MMEKAIIRSIDRDSRTKGRCMVWNDIFRPQTKMIVSISPSAYAYVASDGSMHKNAERIETGKETLAGLWKSKRAHRKPVAKWGGYING
jgi:hypothetical protein